MTTSITFENGTLIAAVRRLDKIAPRKGEAFDKAQGIVFDLDPTKSTWGLITRVTNLDIYYMEWLNYVEMTGDPTRWRFSAALLSPIISKLPAGSGKTTTFTELPPTPGSIARKIEVKSGRIKANLLLLDHTYYPEWSAFSPSLTMPVESLGARIEQVAWAAAKGSGEDAAAITGLRFDGESLVATDRYRLASVPMPVEHLGREVVVPISLVGSMIKDMGECRIGVEGEQLLIVPNDFTQMRCIMLGAQYPPVSRVMLRDHPNSFKVAKTDLIESIARVGALGSGSRQPILQMWVGQGELALVIEDDNGINKIMEVIDLGEQADHTRCLVNMKPQNIVDALVAAPGEVVTIFYDPSNDRKLVRITGAHGFEAWCAPINPAAREAASSGPGA